MTSASKRRISPLAICMGLTLVALPLALYDALGRELIERTDRVRVYHDPAMFGATAVLYERAHRYRMGLGYEMTLWRPISQAEYEEMR